MTLLVKGVVSLNNLDVILQYFKICKWYLKKTDLEMTFNDLRCQRTLE